ncbi:unnamed protein product [Larinioides sclopetarius]|uniref:SOCS box domain-containing protein n=1 Tax=Larinioides sclopetarius TaxID=280406 RepID=A0AAV1YTH2_9ARAC
MAVAVFNEASSFRRLQLDEAKDIVKQSSIVHKSITHLDLNIGEYNDFKNDIATLDTDSSAASKVCLPSKETFERFSHMLILKYEKEFYTPKIYVSKSWYRRKLQDFIILCIKRAEHTLISLEKFKFRGSNFWTIKDSMTFIDYYSLNILCMECYDSNTVKGILIALDILDPDFENAKAEVNQYFLYQNSILSSIGLSETTDFGKDIIRILMHNEFYTFVPHLLKRGFSLKASFSGNEDFEIWRFYYCPWDVRGISIRRRDFVYYAHRIHPDTRLNGIDILDRPAESQTLNGSKALTMMWRTIPDVLLTQEEISHVYNEVNMPHSVEKIQNFYKTIAGDCPQHPMPRSLEHYCRLIIRRALAFNRQLPHGINKLGLPPPLPSFLNLEY